MNLFGKIIAFFVSLSVLAFGAIAVIVHFYVTDERVRAIVVPQAEEALGRQVTIGAIKIGIFSGITISDLTIKERDKQNDFVKAGEFILSYDLMPLLQKKFVINEIRLNAPVINVSRDKNGKFNFNSLALLEKTKSPSSEKTEPASAAPVSLPVALIIEKIKIVKGVLVVHDAKKEIPDTRVVMDLSVSLDMADSLASLKFKGDLGMVVDLKYGGISPHVKVSINFDQDRLSYQADIDLDGEKIQVAGNLNQFLTAAPEIICNVSSRKLDIDHLLALVDSLPKSDASTPKPQSKKGAAPKKEAIAKAIPTGVVAHGLIAVDEAIYQKIAITDFKVDYDLRQGIFTKKISANVVGGALYSNAIVDLNQLDPTYKGDIAINSIDLKQLGSALGSDFADVISGSFQSKINFDGRGVETEVIKKNLTADATYSLTDGWIKNTQITKAIAQLTGLTELQDMTFEKMGGTVKLLKGGKMRLVTSMNAANLGMATEGEVDLDGKLNLPITLTLSPTLSQKLPQQGGVGKFLANDKGETELHLKVGGTTKNPQTSLDTSGMQKQLEGVVKAKAMDALGGLISREMGGGSNAKQEQPVTTSNKEPVLNLFKGLMGQ